MRILARLLGRGESSGPAKRETGIEPASLAWKASALPLSYSRGQIGEAGFEPAASASRTLRANQTAPLSAILSSADESADESLHPSLLQPNEAYLPASQDRQHDTARVAKTRHGRVPLVHVPDRLAIDLKDDVAFH
jgi:hypothetical protein